MTEYVVALVALVIGLIIPVRLMGQALLTYYSMQMVWLKLPFP